MSLKSFHIIFIFISSLFMVYFSYWSITNWLHYNDAVYMTYGVMSLFSFVLLLFYSKQFIKKYKKIIR